MEERERLTLISNNCLCRMSGEPFLMIFQKLGEGRWELFQGLHGAFKPFVSPEEDELFQLDPDVLRYGVSVAPDYRCPYCHDQGNTFAICSSCQTAFCTQDTEQGEVECPSCHRDGQISEAQEVDFHDHLVNQREVHHDHFEDAYDEDDVPF